MSEAQELVSFMDRGVLRMPYELAMSDEISRVQFYGRVQGLLDRIESASSEQQAAQQDAERYKWLLEQAWFQAAFDRFEPQDRGMQKKFVEECARIIDAARASNGGKA